MKAIIFSSLLLFSAASCGKIDQDEEAIQRQEEYEREEFEEEGQPIDSTEEMDYYRDVINEGELDN